jgi:hypothetical protein
MANAYGPEFNLTNEEIIDTIRKTYKIESIGPGFDPLDVEVMLYNNDYYVRPGETKRRFMKEFGNILSKSNPLTEALGENMTYLLSMIQTLGLIKEYFDENYFEEQVERRTRSMQVTVNKDKLRKLLKKLDKDKFEFFFITAINGRLERGLFITDVSSANLWLKIRESCRASGANVPEDVDIAELKKYTINDNGYYFNILSPKTLANILCDAIDLDIEMATVAVQKLYSSGRASMVDYIQREANAKTSA